jgi:HK97 family phage prohead protease
MLYASPEWAAWKQELLNGHHDACPPDKGYKLESLVTLQLTEEQRAQRIIPFILSTSIVDRDRDTIAVQGWDISNYKKNPTVLWAHNYREPPIGQALEVGIQTDHLYALDQFMERDLYEFADLIYRMIMQGFLRTCSVGFRPLTWAWNEERRGVDFFTQELLEHSIVPVPSNPQALVQARSAGFDLTLLREWAHKTYEDLAPEAGLWLPRSKVEQVLTLLEASVYPVPGQVEVLEAHPLQPLTLRQEDVNAIAQQFMPGLANVLRRRTGTVPALEPASGIGDAQAWVTGIMEGQRGKFAAIFAALKQPDIDPAQLTMMLQECLECLQDTVSCAADAMDGVRDVLGMLAGEGASGADGATPSDGDTGNATEPNPLLTEDGLRSRWHKGVSPSDASKETAPMDTPWSAPNLSDFANEAWSELPEDEKRHITQHYAWAQAMPPETFGGLKLPHHRPSDGYIVWRGVTNAAARLPQAQIPNSDMAAVRAHLGRHYRAFGRTPPWDANANAWTEYEQVCRRLEEYVTDRKLQQRYGELLDLLFPNDPNVPDAIAASAQDEGDHADDDLLLLDLDGDTEPVSFTEGEAVVMLTDDHAVDALDLSGLSREDLQTILRDAVQAGVQSALTPYTGRLPDA